MKARAIIAAVALSCLALFSVSHDAWGGMGAPAGCAEMDINVDDTSVPWELTIGLDSPWRSKLDDGDELVAWGTRRNSFSGLVFNPGVTKDDFGDFLCDKMDDGKREIWLFVINNQASPPEGRAISVRIDHPVDDFCP